MKRKTDPQIPETHRLSYLVDHPEQNGAIRHEFYEPVARVDLKDSLEWLRNYLDQFRTFDYSVINSYRNLEFSGIAKAIEYEIHESSVIFRFQTGNKKNECFVRIPFHSLAPAYLEYSGFKEITIIQGDVTISLAGVRDNFNKIEKMNYQ